MTILADDITAISFYSRLYDLHRKGAFFVTRAKQGMDARRVYSVPVDRASGVICD